MAYHETNIQKIKKLLNDPKTNIRKIIPFLKSKTVHHHRDICEFFGSDKYSKPYPGHVKLLKFINKKDGFFVQCGGNDGYFQDPTYYLEKFQGWHGIIVEPLPISKLCRRNRKNSEVIQSACVSFDYKEKTVSFVDCNAMSFVKNSIEDSASWIKIGEEAQRIKSREIVVLAQTIQSILNKKLRNKNIDLFVADVEGYEQDILCGLDFSKNSPNYILLEIQTDEKFKKITDYISSKGYTFVSQIVEKDYLFQKK